MYKSANVGFVEKEGCIMANEANEYERGLFTHLLVKA